MAFTRPQTAKEKLPCDSDQCPPDLEGAVANAAPSSTPKEPMRHHRACETDTTSSRTAVAKKAQFPFLKLPPELRNRIYKLVLIRRWPIIADIWFMVVDPPALTQVCQQLRRETLPIFYGANKFAGDVIGDQNSLLLWFRSIGHENCRLIRQLQILVGPDLDHNGSAELPEWRFRRELEYHNIVFGGPLIWDGAEGTVSDEIGSSSAAVVARDMLFTFPNIRVGLLVGIGAGIPNYDRDDEKDVRLGDAVISSDKRNGGVVVYDFGKRLGDGSFEAVYALDRPPRSLRTALARLEMEHEMRENRIPQYLEAMLEKYPRLKNKGFLYYADSHKNDQWQPYAAATAAACAKELLEYIQPRDVDETRAAKDVLNQVSESLLRIEDHSATTRGLILTNQEDQFRAKVIFWISSLDFAAKYRDSIGRRHIGTGLWLLDSAAFQA
ncbi:hypothetical protein B0A49_00654, partial [Cryomyces minteri]